jgi:hypothetical protein
MNVQGVSSGTWALLPPGAPDCPVRAFYLRLRLPQGGREVLWADLNRSESRSAVRPSPLYSVPIDSS